MIVLVLLGLLAGARAAPCEPCDQHPYGEHESSDYEDYFDPQVYNIHRLYNAPSEQILDNKYIITLQLQGFDKHDFKVIAKKEILVIYAFHEIANEPDTVYFKKIKLPDNIVINENWTYEKGLLTIVFPIKQVQTTTTSPDPDHKEKISIDERIGI